MLDKKRIVLKTYLLNKLFRYIYIYHKFSQRKQGRERERGLEKILKRGEISNIWNTRGRNIYITYNII